MIRWAIECGTPEQCQLVLALYHCTNDDDYQAMGIQLSRSIDNANVSPIIFFTGKNQRLLGDISMLKQLEEKADVRFTYYFMYYPIYYSISYFIYFVCNR
ncbi:hypothetical protein J4731_21505 [Providencia rettgeri]|nr:hypothetical protein [Providencia rettgeri]